MGKSKFMIFVGGAAVIIGVALIVFKAQNSERTNYPPATQGNAIEVSDQRAGKVVTLDSAILEQPGFAVVYEANGTRLGDVLGTSPLLATGENKVIFITASTIANKEYFVVLHGDNGNSTFNEGSDAILKDLDRKEVRVKFKAL